MKYMFGRWDVDDDDDGWREEVKRIEGSHYITVYSFAFFLWKIKNMVNEKNGKSFTCCLQIIPFSNQVCVFN